MAFLVAVTAGAIAPIPLRVALAAASVVAAAVLGDAPFVDPPNART